MSWNTPKTDWATDTGIGSADLNRIEGNDVVLHKGNGQASLASITAANSLLINQTDETFIVTGDTAIYYICKTGRQPGNKIVLCFTGNPEIHHQQAGPGAEYAAINTTTAADQHAVNGTYFAVYDGTYWRLIGRDSL